MFTVSQDKIVAEVENNDPGQKFTCAKAVYR